MAVTSYDVLMWALINRARLDPAGEAARDGIDLNEGLAPGTISSASKQPLAWNPLLFNAADGHSLAMLSEGYFGHIDPVTSSTPFDRIALAGYAGGAEGENLAEYYPNPPDPLTPVLVLEQGLFVDNTTPGRLHRVNLLDDNYQEVGVSQEIGLLSGQSYSAAMVTQDFAASGGQILTGIAYNDTSSSGFYAIGEGRGGISVVTSSGTAVTDTPGEYEHLIGSGQQTVTFSGGDLGAPVTVVVTITPTASGGNALLDLVGQSAVETSVSLVAGTGVTKIIGLGNQGLTLIGNNLGDTFVTPVSGTNTFDGGTGVDTVVFGNPKASYTITNNGNGTTTVSSGSLSDTVSGIENLQFSDQTVALIPSNVIVAAGQTSTGVAVSGGVYIQVNAGGTALGTTLGSGGTEYDYGSASGTTVMSGGQELVYGTATAATVSSGGYDYIGAGGTASGAHILGGGAEYVASGGAANGSIVSGGANQYVSSGGTTSGTQIGSGAVATLYSGGSANATSVGGGTDYVLAGGKASGTIIGPLGIEIDYGSAGGNTVGSGGYDYVAQGGVASGTQVGSGGYEFVGLGGTASGAHVASGGAAFAQSGGSANNTIVSAGALQILQGGGSASATTLSGGVQYVLPGATAAGTVVGNGGVEVDYGFITSASVASGYDLVGSGATASATAVNGGSEYVLSGGSATGTTVSNGLEVVFGVVSAVVLGSGASEFVSSGGTASGTTIGNGATDYVLAGGIVSGANLAGGTEFVFGTATSAIISGGAQHVEAGGTAAATILSGGIEDIGAGGVATGMILRAGYAGVAAGGIASGTILSGGYFEVASGAMVTGSGAVTFSSGGILRLDDSIHFGGLVAGFSVPDVMDLADIPFVSSGGSGGATTATWTQLTSGASASGSLLVAQDGHSANLTLLGQYVQGNFHILNDGAGATLVTDPPVVTAITDPGPFPLVVPYR
jgi:autotransporter passenger strand-loop-strand repeat protein